MQMNLKHAYNPHAEILLVANNEGGELHLPNKKVNPHLCRVCDWLQAIETGCRLPAVIVTAEFDMVMNVCQVDPDIPGVVKTEPIITYVPTSFGSTINRFRGLLELRMPPLVCKHSQCCMHYRPR